MSIRRLTDRMCFGLLAVAASGLLLCSAQAGEKTRGRSIDFSEPRSDEVTTNLHQLTVKKDSLKQLEEDLYKPLQLFAPKTSLDGVPAPPPRPPATSVIQSKRAKELLERRENWVFMTPEDLLAGPTVDDILKSPQYDKNGQEKKDLSSMEGYYRRMTTKRSSGDYSGQVKTDDLLHPTKTSNPLDQLAVHEDSSLPTELRESALALKQLTESDGGANRFGQSTKRNSFSDTFGLDGNAPTKEQALAHQKYMDEYRAVVEPGWQRPPAASAFGPQSGLAAASRSAGSLTPGLGGSPSSAPHKGLEAQMDITHPLLGPAGLPDLNAQALGRPRQVLDIPKVETPVVGVPKFAAPKRVF